MHFKYALEKIRRLNPPSIVVGVAQRTGTTICAKMLASELEGFTFMDESSFGVSDLASFKALIERPGLVVQAPALSYMFEEIEHCAVVCMQRRSEDILRSEDRIGWPRYQTTPDRLKYRDLWPQCVHPHLHTHQIKLAAWEEQKLKLGDRAIEIDYNSLSEHRLWIPQEQRKNFSPKQTEILPQ